MMIISKKTFFGFIVSVSVALLVLFFIPFFVFANGDAEIEPHEEVVVEQIMDEEEHFVEDGHTDHTHATVTTELWWQSPVWWGLFLTSLLLILLLSFGVYKYLQDKPVKIKSSSK